MMIYKSPKTLSIFAERNGGAARTVLGRQRQTGRVLALQEHTVLVVVLVSDAVLHHDEPSRLRRGPRNVVQVL